MCFSRPVQLDALFSPHVRYWLVTHASSASETHYPYTLSRLIYECEKNVVHFYHW